jgi:hypothetical protein
VSPVTDDFRNPIWFVDELVVSDHEQASLEEQIRLLIESSQPKLADMDVFKDLAEAYLQQKDLTKAIECMKDLRRHLRHNQLNIDLCRRVFKTCVRMSRSELLHIV